MTNCRVRSIPAIKREDQTRCEKFNRFGSIVVAAIREIPLPSPPPVKFCRVNHNVTSIHPRDRDWQSAYTRVHARLMNLPCPTLHVSGRNASVRARARGARGPLLLLASARCPGWDTLWEITLYIWCYLFSWKQLWKFGKRDFFGKFFLFSGRKKRELKVVEVSKFFCLDF